MHKKASNFGARINIHSSFFLYRTQLCESSENSSVYSKLGTFQSTGLGSPGDWTRPDLTDPVACIGVPVAWIRQKLLGCGFSRLGHFLVTWIKDAVAWIPDAVACILLFSTFG
jgi:hypothetical protein